MMGEEKRKEEDGGEEKKGRRGNDGWIVALVLVALLTSLSQPLT
jgi:hypothetical protein